MIVAYIKTITSSMIMTLVYLMQTGHYIQRLFITTIFISGGMVQNNGTYTAVKDFKHLNLETLFDVNYSYTQQPDYSCMHTYYTSSRIYEYIDEFIYEDDSKLMFETIPLGEASRIKAKMRIYASPEGVSLDFDTLHSINCSDQLLIPPGMTSK
eukprot:615608_1